MNVLFLSPHTDDVEFACGGTLATLHNNKDIITLVAFSSADESNAGYDLKAEFSHAMGVLVMGEDKYGITTGCYNHPVRNFPHHRQKILEEMINLKKQYRPDIVFCPSTHDMHQDHKVICNEAIRAFKKDTTILGYYHKFNCRRIDNDIYQVLTPTQFEKKLEVIACYKSQKDKPYADPRVQRSICESWGSDINAEYAECFECIRQVHYSPMRC